jgi:hypothetical protein
MYWYLRERFIAGGISGLSDAMFEELAARAGSRICAHNSRALANIGSSSAAVQPLHWKELSLRRAWQQPTRHAKEACDGLA